MVRVIIFSLESYVFAAAIAKCSANKRLADGCWPSLCKAKAKAVAWRKSAQYRDIPEERGSVTA
ncbi:MAG: hypothetical protein WCL43_05715 [Chlorobium sp.]